jgi:hypothetical protein
VRRLITRSAISASPLRLPSLLLRRINGLERRPAQRATTNKEPNDPFLRHEAMHAKYLLEVCRYRRAVVCTHGDQVHAVADSTIGTLHPGWSGSSSAGASKDLAARQSSMQTRSLVRLNSPWKRRIVAHRY